MSIICISQFCTIAYLVSEVMTRVSQITHEVVGFASTIEENMHTNLVLPARTLCRYTTPTIPLAYNHIPMTTINRLRMYLSSWQPALAK